MVPDISVCIDGEERWQCDPRLGLHEPFRVPLSASYIEIFGDDDDGELLLAVFPLPEPESGEDGRVQHMFVTLEGGQTVAIEMALGDRTYGEVCEYYIQIAYSEFVEVGTRGTANPAVEEIPMGGRRRRGSEQQGLLDGISLPTCLQAGHEGGVCQGSKLLLQGC